MVYFHDTKLGAERLVGVGDQRERQLVLLLEILMRFKRIARYANDKCRRRHKGVMVIAKIHALRGAARGVVLWIKVQHQGLLQLG